MKPTAPPAGEAMTLDLDEDPKPAEPLCLCAGVFGRPEPAGAS